MLSFCKKNFFNFFFGLLLLFWLWKKNKKKFFGQNSKSWFVYFTNQEIPQVGFFFGEKATLKESYEPSLGKLRWPAFFMTVYPTVYGDDLRVIFDQWPMLHLGLDALSNQKILNGI